MRKTLRAKFRRYVRTIEKAGKPSPAILVFLTLAECKLLMSYLLPPRRIKPRRRVK